jgi:hypothetical protein
MKRTTTRSRNENIKTRHQQDKTPTKQDTNENIKDSTRHQQDKTPTRQDTNKTKTLTTNKTTQGSMEIRYETRRNKKEYKTTHNTQDASGGGTKEMTKRSEGGGMLFQRICIHACFPIPSIPLFFS